jgi:anti-sigma B factor antagonist
MLTRPISIGGDDMPGAGFEVRWAEGLPVVSAPAEIDTTNADELRRAMLSCVNEEHATLVVDMTKTTFCDSAGMKELVQAHKEAAAAGGEVRLVVGTVSVMRVLALVGADQVLPIFTDLDEALADGPGPEDYT